MKIGEAMGTRRALGKGMGVVFETQEAQAATTASESWP